MTTVAAPLPAVSRLRGFVGTPRFARFASLAAVLGFWQLVVPFLPTELIPSPARVAQFMWDEVRGVTVARATVWEAFGISLRRLVLGFLLAFGVGVPIGLMMGVSRALENFFQDFVVVGLAMPSLVWALLTGIWFGMGDASPIVTVFLAGVPFVIINTFEGVRDVPKDLTDMAAAFGVGRSKTVRHVVLASLMPFFFASLRYGLANGWKGLVLAEVFASTAGAGWTIQFWRDAHRAQGVFGYALFFVIFALLLERLVFQRLARRVFRWRPEIGAAAVIPEVAIDKFVPSGTDPDDEDR